MEVLINIAVVIGIAWFIGFSNAMITKWLDSALDYQKIFGNIRFQIVKRYAKNAGKLEEFEKKIETAILPPNFSDRLNGVNSVYWEMVAFAPGIQRFICKTCMATNILLPSFIFYGYVLLGYDYHWSLFLIYLLSFSFNEYYINK